MPLTQLQSGSNRFKTLLSRILGNQQNGMEADFNGEGAGNRYGTEYCYDDTTKDKLFITF